MSDEALIWLQYARENLQVAEMTFAAALLNPCLQNAQQTVEKALKAIRIHRNMRLRQTHSIRDLNRSLARTGIETGLSEEDCELLDSIYIISKYPLHSVLPESPPDLSTCQRCLDVARHVLSTAENAVRG